MHKISVVITGQVKSSVIFFESLKEFIALKEEGIVNEIVLSTWKGEIEKLNESITKQLNEHVVIITPNPPKVNSGTAFYQMKSLHCALNKLSDKKTFVFKTRPDLYISKEDIKEIIKLDNNVRSKKSPFVNKVWVPWFEVSKPFYMADECFYCNYPDAIKLYNYDTIYDNYFDIDAGISHIRRFYHPFTSIYPEFEHFFLKFGVTGHGTSQRFRLFDVLYENVNYKKGLRQYYKILEHSFNIGLHKYGYITFREWNKSEKKTIFNSLEDAVKPINSFEPSKGHVYGYNNNDVKTLLGDDAIYNEVIPSEDDDITKVKIFNIMNSMPKVSLMKRILFKVLSYVK
ncbi:TPA: hypothetical protein ACOJPC_002313 [Vibrio fluvialis]|uniref:hypothetical protein n=1 Tax=Vibrio fluvialis TaxID=676 RepID=UPI0029869131|nr:hypothetical protein [Vibrio fluvialis]EKO3996550.1 hypothetical protein [Vibrio fluvialis]